MRCARPSRFLLPLTVWLVASGCASIAGLEDLEVVEPAQPDASAEGSAGSAGDSSLPSDGGDAKVDAALDADAAGDAPLEAGKDVDAEAGCTKDEKVCDNKCVLLTAPETGCGKVSCDACVFTHASAKCATDGSCAMDQCNKGFDNCDKDASNGCEGNLDNDPKNCGACGTICPAVGGTPICDLGKCGLSSCDIGKGDCDGDKGNGCETDTNTSVANCGFCKNACLLSYATPKCEAGTCKVDTCSPGRGNCDTNDSNGCEIDTDTEAANCGTCGNVCPTLPNSVPLCVAGKCNLTCTGSFADCDADTTNGCETDLTSTVSHCGTCSTVCTTPNGTPKCEASICKVAGCNSGFADCDTQTANGCESDLTSLQHCGTCANACGVPANASASCTVGVCGFSCNAGFDNCDGDVGNGCEANLMGDPQHCSSCATVCALPNATQACVGGACQIAGCVTGWGDCNGASADGCEIDLTTSLAHCGSCPTPCAPANANPVCLNGTCQITSCVGAFANCDGQVGNGCEVNLNSSMTSCGTCGKLCDLAHASEQCVGGACLITTCDAPFLNCDLSDSTGCEVNSTNDAAHCGTCATTCAAPHATGVCANSVCAIGSCDAGWGNCDGVIGNGCETNTSTSLAHCGGCFSPCSFSNAAASCAGGTCTLGACNAGYGNCDSNPNNGCEAQFAVDPANCGSCGHSCLGGGCTGGKCDPITIASLQNHPWSIATDGAYVYWDNRTAAGGSVMRVAVTGGVVTTLASNQLDPDGLGINATSVFWVSNDDGKIQSVPLAGGPATLLATTALGAGPAGLAVAGSYVYVANWSSNTVQRVLTSGGALSSISTSGNSTPNRVVSDGTYVWWTNSGGNDVRRADVGGGNVLTSGVTNSPAGIAFDGTYVYWTAQIDNSIVRALPNLSSMTTIASGQDNPSGIAVDATHVYWVNSGASGTVRRVLKAGGTPETLAVGQQSPMYIALDSVSLYWASPIGGSILRQAK